MEQDEKARLDALFEPLERLVRKFRALRLQIYGNEPPMDMNDRLVQALVATRVRLLFDDHWYGNLATRCLIRFDETQDSLVVTYREMLVSRAWVERVTPEELENRMRAAIDERALSTAEPATDPVELARQKAFLAAMINAHANQPDKTPSYALALMPEIHDRQSQ